MCNESEYEKESQAWLMNRIQGWIAKKSVWNYNQLLRLQLAELESDNVIGWVQVQRVMSEWTSKQECE